MAKWTLMIRSQCYPLKWVWLYSKRAVVVNHFNLFGYLPSCLQRFDTVGLGNRWGVGVVICLERGADCLLGVQLMRLPSQNSIISCLIYIHTGFTFLVPAYPVENRLLNWCRISDVVVRVLLHPFNGLSFVQNWMVIISGCYCQIVTDQECSVYHGWCQLLVNIIHQQTMLLADWFGRKKWHSYSHSSVVLS